MACEVENIKQSCGVDTCIYCNARVIGYGIDKETYTYNNVPEYISDTWHTMFAHQRIITINLGGPGVDGELFSRIGQTYSLKFVETLGKGMFGFVQEYIMTNADPYNVVNIRLALKFMNKIDIDHDKCGINNINKSDNRCPILNVNATKNMALGCIYNISIMPLLDGDISTLPPKIQKTHAAEIIRQVRNQLVCLQKKNLYYLDLKPANVLYAYNKNIDTYKFYLGDIGSLCVGENGERMSSYLVPGYSSIPGDNVTKADDGGSMASDYDLLKYMSWILGNLYIWLITNESGLAEYSIGIYNDVTFLSNYTTHDIKDIIAKNGGYVNMYHFLNKCKKCRPSITEDLEKYLDKTPIEEKEKCDNCIMQDTYICKFCGETVAFSHRAERHNI